MCILYSPHTIKPVFQLLVLPLAGSFCDRFSTTSTILFQMSDSYSSDSEYEEGDHYSDGEVSVSSQGSRRRTPSPKIQRKHRHRSRKSPSQSLSRSRERAEALRSTEQQDDHHPPGVAKIQLCSIHGNNLVPGSCQACKHCSHLVKGDM